jgi:serine/threonine protein kinase
MEMGSFLRLAIGIATALGKLHAKRLVHRDIKPSNILVNRAAGAIKLIGFGLASRLQRERQVSNRSLGANGLLAIWQWTHSIGSDALNGSEPVSIW